MSVPEDLIIQSLVGAALGGSANNAGRNKFKTTYETNAIILFGGIAGASYTNSLNISAIMGGLEFNFQPVPGGQIGSNQVATYPFANQAVAANAIIQQPLNISMLMISVASANGENLGYLSKTNGMLALATSLRLHDNLGGLYSVITPAYTYTNCLRTAMYDASDGTSKQVQFKWRIDFMQPLITLQQAAQVQNSLMNSLSQGNPVVGQPNWSAPSTGNPPGFATNANTSLTAPSAQQ